MSAIADSFAKAKDEDRMAFMPFVTAGDPNLEQTVAVINELTRQGVDLIEVGFPYSDPIADGPVIQASYTRALDSGVSVEKILDMMASLKGDDLPPVLAMVSYAIVFRYGIDNFATKAAECGFSGLIIPDLPADEAEEMSAVALQHNLDLVQLIAPTTTPDRAQQILDASSGFVYCVSVAGTTGVRSELPQELTQQLKQLRQATELPLAVGFGISSPEQVSELEGVADGIIVGSAIVNRVAEAATADLSAESVQEFSTQMRTAVGQVRPSLGSVPG